MAGIPGFQTFRKFWNFINLGHPRIPANFKRIISNIGITSSARRTPTKKKRNMKLSTTWKHWLKNHKNNDKYHLHYDRILSLLDTESLSPQVCFD